MVILFICTSVGGIVGVLWCHQQRCRSTPVMVVCGSRSLVKRFCYMVLYGLLSTAAVFVEKCKGRVPNGPSLSSLFNDGRADVVQLGGGSLMAGAAVMVRIVRCLFLRESCIEFSTRGVWGCSTKKYLLWNLLS